MFRRLRRRLDAMQSQASGTMFNVNELIDAGRDLMDDVQDGVTVTIERDPDAGTILDFITGKTDRLPLSIRIDVEE